MSESNRPQKIAQFKPRPQPGGLLCFLCINDARTAEVLHQVPLPILPATTITNGMAICDAEGRHRITVKPQSGLITPDQNGQLNGFGG